MILRRVALTITLTLLAFAATAQTTVVKCKNGAGRYSYQEPPCPTDEALAGQLKIAATPPTLQSITVGPTAKTPTLVLRPGPGGNYFVPGSVNDVPVVFEIDTGASITTIPNGIGYGTGMTCERTSLASTANGQVTQCESTARSIRFGNFEIKNIKTAMLPNLSSNPLLGMNVLRHFHIEQADGVMTITYKH